MSSLSNCGAHPHDGLNLDGAGNVWWDEEFADAIGELIQPAPPTVVTQPASGVTQTSATLNATVNPNGVEVSECRFEYGTSTSYGSSAPCTPAPGSGTSNVAVSAAVSALAANAAYHFRISATNVLGTSTGADATLKTLPSAPIVQRVRPASISSAQIAALLRRMLTPAGKAARIAALLKANGITITFRALEAGTAVVDWYALRFDRKLSHRNRAKLILVASGRASFKAAGTRRIRIRLTDAGRRLLRIRKTIKLIAKGTFTPIGARTVTATRVIVLVR
jgi:hypothetical protein